MMWGSFVLGGAYALSDTMALGLLYELDSTEYGIYGNLTFAPFVVQADLWFSCQDYLVTALYTFDLNPVTLGAGIGAEFWDGALYPYLKVAANWAACDKFDIYGSYSYYTDGDNCGLNAGVSFKF